MTTEAGDLPPGQEPAPAPPRCAAATELTDEEIAGIVRHVHAGILGWAEPFSYLQVTAACLLSPGHPGQHASRQAITRTGTLAWLRWDNQARAIEWHSPFNCPEWPIEDARGPLCGLFAGHPGQHDVTTT